MMVAMEFLQAWFASVPWLPLPPYNPDSFMKDFPLHGGNAFRTVSYMQVSCELKLLETDMFLSPVDGEYFKRLRPAPWGNHTNIILNRGPKDTGSGRGVLMGSFYKGLSDIENLMGCDS